MCAAVSLNQFTCNWLRQTTAKRIGACRDAAIDPEEFRGICSVPNVAGDGGRAWRAARSSDEATQWKRPRHVIPRTKRDQSRPGTERGRTPLGRGSARERGEMNFSGNQRNEKWRNPQWTRQGNAVERIYGAQKTLTKEGARRDETSLGRIVAGKIQRKNWGEELERRTERRNWQEELKGRMKNWQKKLRGKIERRSCEEVL